MVGAKAGVGVPCAGGALAVKNLDEADPALGEPPGREHLLAERPGDVLVETVEPAGGFVLFVEPQDLGNGRLHAEGQLVRLDPGAELGVGRVLNRREAVEPAQQVGLDRRLGSSDRHPRPGEGQGVGRVDLEHHARVLGAEIIGVGGTHALVFERRAHRDELRQIVAERPQAVVNPRADRRDSSRRADGGR